MSDYQKIWLTPNGKYADSFNGDDLLGDGSRNKPVKSLSRLLTIATVYDTLYVSGYFSEDLSNNQINHPYNSSKFGATIIDFKNHYGVNFSGDRGAASSPGYGVIYMNLQSESFVYNTNSYNTVYVNCENINIFRGSFNIYHGLKLNSNSNRHYFSGNSNNNTIKGLPYTLEYNTSSSKVNIEKTILDDCNIWITKPIINHTGDVIFNTCLFRVNCKFWARNAVGDVIRIDNDSMNASQKEAAIIAFQSDIINIYDPPIPPEGEEPETQKTQFIVFENCQFTDNKILQVSDDPEMIGKDLDYSLIWGPPETHPACHMDNGSHIGALAPTMKLELKNTLQLTENPMELEIPENSGLIIDNNILTVDPEVPFDSIELTSKIIPIPNNSIFNGINMPFIQGEGEHRLHITSFEDYLDLSEGNKIVIPETVGYIPNSNVENDCFYVSVPNQYIDHVIYKNKYYFHGDVITIHDNIEPIYCSENGICFLYPMLRPTLIQSVKLKIYELDREPPFNWLTNDELYPWFDCDNVLTPMDVNFQNSNSSNSNVSSGFRVLREGNNLYGELSRSVKDGRLITTVHPELFIDNTNKRRKLLPIDAKRILFKINIQKI